MLLVAIYMFVLAIVLAVFFVMIKKVLAANKKGFNIILKKNGKFQIIRDIIKGKKFVQGKDTWLANPEDAYIDDKGRELYFFTDQINAGSVNIDLKGKVQFIDPELLSKLIDEEHVKSLTVKENPLKDNLMLFGALGGILAAIVSLINLAMTMGWFG